MVLKVKDKVLEVKILIFFFSRNLEILDFVVYYYLGYNTGVNFQTPDLDDVKESVRQGVHKVAGRLSTLANDVMSSLQDKYGY